MSATARNVLIVAALAAAVALLPGAPVAAELISVLLWLALLSVLALFGARLYQAHRIDLDGLGDRRRAILYGAIGLIVLLLAASARMLGSGGGVVLWLALMAGASYAIYAVWRSSRQY